ncbi:MAG TPA: hypothetical protein VFD92_15695 [Candidatus Binatia bacterium]|nr:hypothetical protein [Candidatus Binatia bacterium]
MLKISAPPGRGLVTAAPAGRSATSRRRGRRPGAISAVTLALVAWCAPAHAFKWHECPAPPVPLNPSTIGATQSPFIHPGHELRIVLNAAEVARTGGFSLDPDGNTIDVTVRSLFGAAVMLPSRTATAVSDDVLGFAFPDADAEIGRDVAGPVEVRVRAGDHLIAWIESKDLIALPPANDVTSLLLGEDPVQSVKAALSVRGDLWIPIRFLGDPGMSMPGCEGNFVLKSPVLVAGAETVGAITRGRDPMSRVRRLDGYIGDMVINGTDFYGLYFPEKIRPLHLAGTLGACVCRMNDASDLVLRMRGSRAWARSPHSPLRAAIADAAPVVLRLRGASPVPGRWTATGDPLDTFGNACETLPPNASQHRQS